MPFDVYPSPQTTPHTLGASLASPALIPIVERIGPDNLVEAGAPATSHPTTMFIRLAMLGPAPALPSGRPTIILKAGTGAETEAITSYPTPTLIPEGANPEVADAFRFDSDANNVYLFKVLVFLTGRTWQMRIKNNDALAHDFTWVVADSLAASRQPWIDLTTPPLPPGATTDYDALTSQTPAPRLTLTVNNHGTGPLTISDAPGTPTTGNASFILAVVPGSIDPNHAGDLQVDFTPPATIGTTNTTHLLNTNDSLALATAGHNRQIALTATTRKLEVVLLVDASGSMGYTPGGGMAVADTDARWGKLKSAAKQFLDLLGTLGAGQGRFGLAMFPDITGPGFPPAPDPSSADILPSTDITAAAITDGKNKLDAPPPSLTPRKPVPNGGATPIGHGIGRVMGTIASSFGFFLGPDTATNKPVTFNKRHLVLMSDGANNSGPPNPPDFYGTGSTSFKGKKIKVIAVGYGDPAVTAFEVDHVLLNTIATESDGQFLDAGADDAGLSLKKQFRTAITTGLSLDPTIDPGGVLTSAGPEVRRQVTITPYDTKVAFVVNWATFNEQRVSVALLTPTCELITPSSAQGDPNISYRSHPTYALYSFNHDYLRNRANPASPRYGTWTLIIAGRGLDGPRDREPYDYEVITESRLRLRLATESAAYFAGDEIKLTALLTLDGKGIANAAVTLRVSAPGQSSDNWLALNKVTAAEFSQAAEQFTREDVTAVGIKSFALKLKGVAFDGSVRPSTIPMTDAANQGQYTATFGNTAVPGTYDLSVTAIGQTADGVAFRREKRLNVRVGVRPDRRFTLVDVTYRRVIVGNQTINVADVRVFPRDRFGNVVLIDPTVDPRIDLAAQGGTFSGPLVGNLDGSYTRSLQYKPEARPVIRLAVDGQATVPRQPLVSIAQLRYVDRVILFKLGAEAERGANRHIDRGAVLGDIAQRRPGTFVSLGSSGVLAVGIEGRVIVAQGEDDITVFVQPDEDLRPYLVEALPTGDRPEWVPLGVSPGVTQTFSLKGPGRSIRAAAAIRITDRGGRTRDSNLKPSPTPGVSLLGIGVKKVGAFPGGPTGWTKMAKLAERPAGRPSARKQ